MLIEVPAKAVAALGDRKRPPVRATVNAYTYRTTVAVYGDRFYLPLRKENRETAKVVAGRRTPVRLMTDEAPRVVGVPSDVVRALARAKLRSASDALSSSRRRELVGAIEDAKRPETRERRLVKLVEELRRPRP